MSRCRWVVNTFYEPLSRKSYGFVDTPQRDLRVKLKPSSRAKRNLKWVPKPKIDAMFLARISRSSPLPISSVHVSAHNLRLACKLTCLPAYAVWFLEMSLNSNSCFTNKMFTSRKAELTVNVLTSSQATRGERGPSGPAVWLGCQQISTKIHLKSSEAHLFTPDDANRK